MVDSQATGEQARKLRSRSNLSLRSVAKKMGISFPFLSDLERGRRNWSEKLAAKFNKAVGVSK